MVISRLTAHQYTTSLCGKSGKYFTFMYYDFAARIDPLIPRHLISKDSPRDGRDSLPNNSHNL
jgi:hypothetical protein